MYILKIVLNCILRTATHTFSSVKFYLRECFTNSRFSLNTFLIRDMAASEYPLFRPLKSEISVYLEY